jgi:hypothetical protein
MADQGAFSIEQLREMKNRPVPQDIAGQFHWLRHRLIAFVGGNVAIDTPVLVAAMDKRVVWLNLDEDLFWALNIDFDPLGLGRLFSMKHNCWEIETLPDDVVSPPGGNRLVAKYKSGEMIGVRFRELQGPDAVAFCPTAPRIEADKFPMTAVEVRLRLPGAGVSVRRELRVGRLSFSSNLIESSGAVIAL